MLWEHRGPVQAWVRGGVIGGVSVQAETERIAVESEEEGIPGERIRLIQFGRQREQKCS